MKMIKHVTVFRSKIFVIGAHPLPPKKFYGVAELKRLFKLVYNRSYETRG